MFQVSDAHFLAAFKPGTNHQTAPLRLLGLAYPDADDMPRVSLPAEPGHSRLHRLLATK